MCPIDRYRLVMYKYVGALASICGVNFLPENYRINIFTLMLQAVVYGYAFSMMYTVIIFDVDTKVKNMAIFGMLLQVSY